MSRTGDAQHMPPCVHPPRHSTDAIKKPASSHFDAGSDRRTQGLTCDNVDGSCRGLGSKRNLHRFCNSFGNPPGVAPENRTFVSSTLAASGLWATHRGGRVDETSQFDRAVDGSTLGRQLHIRAAVGERKNLHEARHSAQRPDIP